MSTLTKKEEPVYVAVGRRKTASARVRLTRGTGVITINGRELADYCYTDELVGAVKAPFKVLDQEDAFDVTVLVAGGGPNGQAAAISHGIARALQKLDMDNRPALKKAGLLKRDPRERERKKVGQPGARKRFQFSKR
ncbi:MAG TPA: 30S ribosomal protein S9 [Opitutales bacterium]|nr:30S ribosomal protein S9 [Opitutales bacterium]HOO93306.1 30S ribosomal protein S9 [Opitutales bacterium]